MDARGQITHTNVLKISETSSGVKYAVIRPIDETRIKHMSSTIRKLTKLNRDLWAFLPELEKKMPSSKLHA